ncbi:MAG: site-2 protease family protein [Planctomycetota bacterium]
MLDNIPELIEKALIFGIFIYSVVLHEIAHGYAAFKAGDNTAYLLGRLSLNPLKHLDWFYTVILPLMLYFTVGLIFGAAKPVPVNPNRYRNYVRDDLMVSSAGVMVNFFLAFFFVMLIHGIVFLAKDPAGKLSASALTAVYVAYWSAIINVFLGVFNLIPIPPLDGSHIFKYLLPLQLRARYLSIGFMGLVIVGVLLYTGIFDKLFLWSLESFLKICMLDKDILRQALN